MKITLERGPQPWAYVVRAEDGRTILIQNDTDYQGWASTFGWTPPDLGVPDRPGGGYMCGTPALALFGVAQAYLDRHVGESVEDPGYFYDPREASGQGQTPTPRKPGPTS